MKYKKWRELEIDPYKIPFQNIKIEKIISYLPAGNDVVECIGIYNDQKVNFFIKIERSKMADFKSEIDNITLLEQNNYYSKLPTILESGNIDQKYYLVLSKVKGKRLSEILKKDDVKTAYLKKYGKELADIHQIPTSKFKQAKQRVINDILNEDTYPKYDHYLDKYLNYLKDNKPNIKMDTFIHGDFHYANVLFKQKDIVGVLDWEYSGKGFKEQDIAWALILRPSGIFFDTLDDIKDFLTGYKEQNSYNEKYLKWCLINGYCHFYIMNLNNLEYISKLKELLELVFNTL